MKNQLLYSVTSEQLGALRKAVTASKIALQHLIDAEAALDRHIMVAHWSELKAEVVAAEDIVYHDAEPFFKTVMPWETEPANEANEANEAPEEGYPTPEECAEWEAEQQQRREEEEKYH